MCCRACSGYELCQAKGKLSEDCCSQCRYFESCMEEPAQEKTKHKAAPYHRAARP
jgi:hypothetical protein